MYLIYSGVGYTSEGRAMRRILAKCINNHRYSTAPVKAIVPTREQVSSVLSITPPLVRAPSQTHRAFAMAIARTQKDTRLIYVYDNGVLTEDSPYNVYAKRQVPLGIPSNSKIISRYIDTGKVYNNRYVFTSRPIEKLK